MERDLEKRLEDCSIEDEIQFQISCMCCNSIWKSSKRTFNLITKEPIDDKKKIIYKAVYEREKRFVQECAGKEAYKEFNYCVICKRWVCDNCFLICDDLDMCKECAERLEEKGVSVV